MVSKSLVYPAVAFDTCVDAFVNKNHPLYTKDGHPDASTELGSAFWIGYHQMCTFKFWTKTKRHNWGKWSGLGAYRAGKHCKTLYAPPEPKPWSSLPKLVEEMSRDHRRSDGDTPKHVTELMYSFNNRLPPLFTAQGDVNRSGAVPRAFWLGFENKRRNPPLWAYELGQTLRT